ncbi:LysR family transcriptional regulator [Solicola gregarius]|uniref:LysR family transcriptional regulator n=1 Tax=Solicola gregarius TaxID=2908642 RepID=A0AA46YMV6_9ACTN|nr:LysR family transcriptional regulator [Solicola gregarius]UYM06866.1 LysR family transcriptional regulator [Solicola gregarius]
MLTPDVRLEWLVSFLAVVDTGSFVAAAEATHRSQPRVSLHVASLERAAGLVIFDRRRRPVELTDAGRSLVEHARAILQQLDAAESAMSAWRGGTRGLVHLGAHPSASAGFVPALLTAVERTAPDIEVSLVERSTLEMDESLRSGQVDLYLRPMTPPPRLSLVESRPLWREPLVVVLPEHHPLATAPEPLAVADVAAYPLISIGRLDHSETASFEPYELFRSAGYELEPVQATNQPDSLVAMVRAGLGLGVTNALAARIANTDGVRIRRLGGTHERVVAVCWNGGRALSPAAKGLFAMIVAAPPPPGTRAA